MIKKLRSRELSELRKYIIIFYYLILLHPP